MTQCVRILFGARPEASIDRSTPAMSAAVSVWGNCPPIAADHQILIELQTMTVTFRSAAAAMTAARPSPS
jgi:hypothetical protein